MVPADDPKAPRRIKNTPRGFVPPAGVIKFLLSQSNPCAKAHVLLCPQQGNYVVSANEPNTPRRIKNTPGGVVPPAGLEPATRGLKVRCSTS